MPENTFMPSFEECVLAQIKGRTAEREQATPERAAQIDIFIERSREVIREASQVAAIVAADEAEAEAEDQAYPLPEFVRSKTHAVGPAKRRSIWPRFLRRSPTALATTEEGIA